MSQVKVFQDNKTGWCIDRFYTWATANKRKEFKIAGEVDTPLHIFINQLKDEVANGNYLLVENNLLDVEVLVGMDTEWGFRGRKMKLARYYNKEHNLTIFVRKSSLNRATRKYELLYIPQHKAVTNKDFSAIIMCVDMEGRSGDE
jgi:hypothetical protein